MQEKWQEFIYDLCEDKKNKVEEKVYHSTIENLFRLLGWVKHKGDICHKERFHNGNNNSLEPDIMIKKDGENQFIVEVKRPVYSQTEKERQQLLSYMRRVKLLVGIYIGEHIEIFYDNDIKGDDKLTSILKIDLNPDDENGAKFVELFSKENFSKDSIIEFCKERIQEMERQETLNKIKESLTSEEGHLQIAESVKLYLMEKYAGTLSKKDITEMLAPLTFKAISKENPTTVSTVPTSDTDLPPKHSQGHKERGNTKDNTRYSLNNGEFLPKNGFVLTVVKHYLKLHPQATFAELERVFPAYYQGSGGVIRTIDYIKRKNYKGERYFMEKDKILVSGDNVSFAVSNQWNKNTIQNIIKKAQELGFDIKSSEDLQEAKPQYTDFINL